MLLFPFDMTEKPYFRSFENTMLKLQKVQKKHTTNQQETFLLPKKKRKEFEESIAAAMLWKQDAFYFTASQC